MLSGTILCMQQSSLRAADKERQVVVGEGAYQSLLKLLSLFLSVLNVGDSCKQYNALKKRKESDCQ